MPIWSLVWEYPLEEEMATHSSILAWRIPWTEEPGRLQSMGSKSWTRLSDWVPHKNAWFPHSKPFRILFSSLLVQYETYAEESKADIPTGVQDIVHFSESVEMWGLCHLFILFSDSTSLSLQANFNSDSAHLYYVTKCSCPILSRDWSLSLLRHISSWSIDCYSFVITVVFWHDISFAGNFKVTKHMYNLWCRFLLLIEQLVLVTLIQWCARRNEWQAFHFLDYNKNSTLVHPHIFF